MLVYKKRIAVLIACCVCGVLGCSDENNSSVPEPLEENAKQMRGDKVLGAPCESTLECQGKMLCDGSSEQGYCRPARCGEECEAQDGVCVGIEGHPAQCWARCEQMGSTEGLKCVDSEGESIAIPEGRHGEVVTFDEMSSVLDVVCESTFGAVSEYGPTRRFEFEITAQDRAFMVVNTIPGAGSFYPLTMTLPDEQVIDLLGDYRHHNARLGDMEGERLVNQGTYGNISIDWSIMFPYSPQRQEVVQAGTYALEVQGEDDLCLYVLKEQQDAGVELDINIYFTDTYEFNAVEGSADEDLQEVLTYVDEIYQKAGISLGKVRYFDVPEEEAIQYLVIRDVEDIGKLASLGRSPGRSLDDVLSVDVFLVKGLVVQQGMLLGVSGGIPGAPGLHGNPANGLVFSVSSLGADNKLVAHIMAHEIGHYLGLRHTTEFVLGGPLEETFEEYLGASDPLEDTPVCEAIMMGPDNCPDVDNLMFPAAPYSGNRSVADISEDQATVFINSPLTK